MLLAAYVFLAALIGVPVEEPFLLTNNNSHPHTKALKDTHTRITQTQTYKHAPTHTQSHTHTHTRTYRQGPPGNIDTPRAKWHVRVSKQSCKQANRLILWGVGGAPQKKNSRFFLFFFLQKNLKKFDLTRPKISKYSLTS